MVLHISAISCFARLFDMILWLMEQAPGFSVQNVSFQEEKKITKRKNKIRKLNAKLVSFNKDIELWIWWFFAFLR